jgi:N-acetylglucosaminyldiphosphoundecaprenol N-acetyl-beta-D-mannosaminyltransferase
MAVAERPLQSSPKRINVLGVGVSIIDLPTAVLEIVAAADQPQHLAYVTATGVHGVIESQSDSDLKRVYNHSFLSTPDGMPMVWVGRTLGHQKISRVYGPDLMLEISKASANTNRGHYYFGGKDGVASELKCCLASRIEGLNVLGTMTPPFRPMTAEEDEALVTELQRLRPHFFWVGLGAPKQERFMYDFLQRHPYLTADWGHGMIMLGVGAAFDFHTGRLRQAPKLMQRCGLEWLFRLAMEPGRLWKRYAYSNSMFLYRIFPQLLGLKKYEMKR